MFKRLISLIISSAICTTAMAADTDIFEPNPLASSENPNILILLDNSANWDAESGGTTKKVLIHEALYKVIMSADDNTMNLGLGIYADSGTGTTDKHAGAEGTKLVNRVENLDSTLKNNYANLLYDNAADLSLIEVKDASGEVIGYTIDGFIDDQEALPKANNAPYAMSMNESRLYFGSMAPEAAMVQPWDKNALGLDQVGNYVSPITLANACGANYIIYLANGAPDSGENNKAEARLKAHGADATLINLSSDKFEANWVDEYAKYMSTADMNDDVPGDQTIVTYVVDIYDETTLKGSNKPGSNNFEGARALLKSVASQGKGKYFKASNSDQVVAALQNILDDILDKSSVFAASALPVSVNTRGTNLNQVYMGVFQPDADRQPRWYGNLKLYQIGNDNGTLELVDQNNVAVRDASRGFVNSNVQSFWTTSSTFFDYAPRGTGAYLTGSDSPDGEVVEKGGAAQQIRENYSSTSSTGRTLYTCISCSSGLQTFNSATTGLNSSLVDWVYGANNASNPVTEPLIASDNDDEGNAAVRASVHGDVVHSQPTIINYGNDNIVIFYGSNDGVFRAVKGGLTGTGVGQELWGFIPEEHIADLNTLRENAGSSLFGSPNKPWFIDGDISAFLDDTNKNGIIESGEKAYLYLTMRRGGNFIYALDVTNYNNPKLLFKINGGTGSFKDLGETWSGIDIVKTSGHSNPVMVFGGGYDSVADDLGPDTLSGSASAGTASTGRGIFMVDAFNGNLVAHIGPTASANVTVPGMKYSIPGRIAVLDTNNNGIVDRLYAADTGGNIWRVDTEFNSNPNNWTVTHLADISNDYDGNSNNDGRKFLYRVDVVSAEDSTGDYDAVLIGSGDREHPFDTGVQNYMYMFKDRYTNLLSTQLSAITMSSMYDATDNLIQQGSDTAAEIALLDTAAGWYIKLGAGEKTVSHVTSLAGVAYFNTNQPDTGTTSCGSNLGVARIYQISVTNATAVIENDQIAGLTLDDRSYEVPGGGYPPPPVHVIVEIDGEIKEAIISGTEINESQADLDRRTRTFWSKQIDD